MFWAVDSTTDADVERFLTGDRTRRVHAIEASWLERLRSARVFAYRLPNTPFEPYPRAAGHWVSREAVVHSRALRAANLLARHADAGITADRPAARSAFTPVSDIGRGPAGRVCLSHPQRRLGTTAATRPGRRS
jgi:hypothetical protein